MATNVYITTNNVGDSVKLSVKGTGAELNQGREWHQTPESVGDNSSKVCVFWVNSNLGIKDGKIYRFNLVLSFGEWECKLQVEVQGQWAGSAIRWKWEGEDDWHADRNPYPYSWVSGRAEFRLTAQRKRTFPGDDIYVTVESLSRRLPPRPGAQRKDVFISHSSEDAGIAESLVELLRAALIIPPWKIRCTSVDGYRLGFTESVQAELRWELETAKVLVALITAASLRSQYVLLELGARWGAALPIVMVLARSQDRNILVEPFTDRNALACDDATKVHLLLSELSRLLDTPLCEVPVFQRYVDALVNKVNEPASP